MTQQAHGHGHQPAHETHGHAAQRPKTPPSTVYLLVAGEIDSETSHPHLAGIFSDQDKAAQAMRDGAAQGLAGVIITGQIYNPPADKDDKDKK
jgi:hypothetical protein